MARPQKFLKSQIEEALTEANGLVSVAARRLQCCPNCVRAYVRRYPSLQTVIDSEREALVDHAEVGLRERIGQGDIAAIIFTLKTLGKKRGYIERQEIRAIATLDEALNDIDLSEE